MIGRTVAAAIVLCALGGLVLWAAGDLAPFGTPPDDSGQIVRALVHERHVANTVMGVTFDLRGLDTLIEGLILFVAALGAAVLLRHGRGAGQAEREPGPPTPDALRVAGAVLVGPLIVLGAWVVVHGHLTPG